VASVPYPAAPATPAAAGTLAPAEALGADQQLAKTPSSSGLSGWERGVFFVPRNALRDHLNFRDLTGKHVVPVAYSC
jgi:hypothetical protein